MAEIEEAEIEAEPAAGPSAHWEHDHAATSGEGRRLCPVCTFLNDEEGDSMQCGMCHNSFCEDLWASASAADLQRSSDSGSNERNWSLSSYIPGLAQGQSLINGAVSGALTGMFAFVGACTGAVAGALAGRATDSGVLRGAGLGLIAGAVVSVEALERAREMWKSALERLGVSMSAGNVPPATIEYIEDLLQDRFGRGISLRGNRWQVEVDDMSYEELYEFFGPGRVTYGASPAAIASLPLHTIGERDRRDSVGNPIGCPICLQELCAGDRARSLPFCRHTFHQPCVDTWLSQHGICPVCRHDIRESFSR
ncbi:Zinc finger RING-type domain containing protein [Klebsormidium nitens]|uniref:Zinc finger RING-type domain containing protein n=1 Tax=Klebsormidium nitens TaxID=105231 RepID=A0A1Y1HRZ4_KLENI|nr:Zinc finger RING-type domain containing protein [Klebsormidium nitens]|eukprot:GAQ79751.1 Zinc finger RING-type domain containing protein [Klebsormidium nitens]